MLRKILVIALFFHSTLFAAQVFACEAPKERFCVDFYKGTNLEGAPLASKKTRHIKYNWASRNPARRVPYDNFSARFRGVFHFKNGQYSFKSLADDGVRLMIDGQPVVNQWQGGLGLKSSTLVELGSGAHLIEVEYFEATGDARLEVDWKWVAKASPLVNTTRKIIPEEKASTNQTEQSSVSSLSAPINKAPVVSVDPITVARITDTESLTIASKQATTEDTIASTKTEVASLNGVTAPFAKTDDISVDTAATIGVKNTEVERTKHPGNVKKAAIGVNLSSFSYYSSSVPFKDLMMQTGGLTVLKKDSNEPCPEKPALDQENYPTSLPSGCIIRIWSVFHIRGDDFWPTDTLPYRPGHYVLLHQGRGKISMGWDAKNVVFKSDGRIEFDVVKPKDGIQIVISAMERNYPIRDIHIIHADDEKSFREQPFNERWLALLKPFKVLRFMDWGAVSANKSVYYSPAVSHKTHTITLPDSAPAEDGVFNNMVALLNVNGKWPRVMIDRYDGATRTLFLKSPIEISRSGEQPVVTVYDFLNRTWKDRAPATTLGQGSAKGVAFETMIKLANTLDADPWFTIPTAADDNFVENLALLLKKSLKPTLKPYIEYSNETWNFGFPGYNYSEAKVRELQLSSPAVQADAWHAYRAVEIFKIFNRVFGEADLKEARQKSRLVRVLTSQTAWMDRAKSVMDWKMPNNGLPTQGYPAYKFADAWAVTTYFYLGKNKTLETLSMDELFTEQTDNINSLFGDSKNPGLIRKILEECNSRGLQMIAYEGGTHLLAPQNDAELVSKLAQINKDQRIKDVYKVMLSHWNKLYQEYGSSSVGVLNHYSDISRYGKFGYWGLMQSTYQDPASAPKYQAISEYVKAP